MRISCDTKYPYLIEKIKQAIKEIFPENVVGAEKYKHAHCLALYSHSNHWDKILSWKVGHGSKFVQRAHIPRWIFDKKEYIIRCLCGLIETDGSIYSDRGYKMMMFTSIIPELTDDFATMVCVLGFQPHWYRIIPKSKFNSQPCYHIRLSKNVDEFLKIVKPEKR